MGGQARPQITRRAAVALHLGNTRTAAVPPPPGNGRHPLASCQYVRTGMHSSVTTRRGSQHRPAQDGEVTAIEPVTTRRHRPRRHWCAAAPTVSCFKKTAAARGFLYPLSLAICRGRLLIPREWPAVCRKGLGAGYRREKLGSRTWQWQWQLSACRHTHTNGRCAWRAFACEDRGRGCCRERGRSPVLVASGLVEI